MKTVSLLLKDRELHRFQLNQPTIFIGRSPTCDHPIRAKSIRPLHFVIEWFGDGQFDPEKGFWSVIEISSSVGKQNSSGEGLILSDEPIFFGTIQFKFIRDDLAESNLKKGVLKRSLDTVAMTGFSSESQKPCLEIVTIRNSLGSVESVSHYNFIDLDRGQKLFSDFPELIFKWKDLRTGLIEGKSSQIEIFNKNELFESANHKYEFTDRDVIIARSKDYDYFLRVVPQVEIRQGKRKYFDSTLMSLATILLILFLLNAIASKIPPLKDVVSDTQRIAHVDLYQPENKVIAPEPVPQAPPVPEQAKEEIVKKSEAPVAEKKETIEKKVESAKKTAPIKTVETKQNNSSGLNQKVAVQNVNQVGILGAIKAQKSSGTKGQISADKILSNRPPSEMDSAGGKALVARTNSAVLGSVEGKGAGGNQKVDLNQASTTLKNSFAKSQGGVGAIANNSGSTLEKGLNLQENGRSLKMGNPVGFEDGTTTEVQGGLDKDNVRQAIKENQMQIRACYEKALSEAINKELAGKITFFWKITPDGDVADSKMTYTDFKMATFENCVKRIIDRIIFPKAKNKQPTFVKYPFLFQGKK